MVAAAMGKRTMRRALLGLAALALLSAGGLVAYAGLTESPDPATPAVDWEAAAAGPTDDLTVYWVGHSLFNHRDPRVDEAPHLMDQVGALAEARGLAYEAFDQTLFGANLSLAVRGEPHSYSRQEPEFAARRSELAENGARYDALVMTEGIPVRNAEQPEHSAYYAMTFYCAITRANPDARVYLYEGPIHLQAGDPDARYGARDEFGWAAFMEEDRAVWERIADLAATGSVVEPGLGPRLRNLLGLEHGDHCPSRGPIFLIPAATVMIHVAERLADPDTGDVFELAGGERLTRAHFYQNPYRDWPEEWPLPPHEGVENDEEPTLAQLHPMHPDEEFDDVHPSRLGTYLNGLTTFAVLYRQPLATDDATLARDAATTGLTPQTVATLRRLVWEVVAGDPRAGVTAEATE